MAIADVSNLQLLGDGYEVARSRFLDIAKRGGAKTISQAVPSKIADDLFIDAAFYPARKKSEVFIVLISGQHGVEAPAGSAIQRRLMDSVMAGGTLEVIDRDRSSVLMIHGMNPYGFKFSRRVNENNVDLNRNCFDAEQAKIQGFSGASIVNPNYDKVRSILESDLESLAAVAKRIGSEQGWKSVFTFDGFATIAKALTGQYKHPRGIYYGGTQVEAECAIVQKIIADCFVGEKNSILLNFHTGLGKWATTQILTTPPDDLHGKFMPAYQRELDCLYKIFSQKAQGGKDGVHQIRRGDQKPFFIRFFNPENVMVQGELTQWMNSFFGDRRSEGIKLALTIETGTYRGDKVLLSLVRENFQHWNLKDKDRKSKVTSDLCEMFNPRDPQWQASVLRTAEFVGRALVRFSREN